LHHRDERGARGPQGELPPASESCVFVVNHASFYDVPIMFAALRDS
jgi:1-acyl-sn-glycerol-3-phosphate acyltransferase